MKKVQESSYKTNKSNDSVDNPNDDPEKTIMYLNDSIKKTYEIIDVGDMSLAELQRQKNQLQKVTEEINDINTYSSYVSRLLNKIQFNQNKEVILCLTVIIILGIIICLLLYFRFRNVSA